MLLPPPWAAHGGGASEVPTEILSASMSRPPRALAGAQRGKERDGKLRVWRGNGEGKHRSEAAARSRSRDLQKPNPNTPENNSATLRSVSLYTKSLLHINYEYCEVRVLRVVASITSKNGIGGHGGRLRSRDLQQTNPCAPENFLAAPRSAHLITKSLVYEQLFYTKQGEGGELKTREREDKIRTQTTPRLEPTAQRPQPATWAIRDRRTHGARAILNIKYDPESSGNQAGREGRG